MKAAPATGGKIGGLQSILPAFPIGGTAQQTGAVQAQANSSGSSFLSSFFETVQHVFDGNNVTDKTAATSSDGPPSDWFNTITNAITNPITAITNPITSTITNIETSIEAYFIRAVVIILGFIFVAVGLSMFKATAPIVNIAKEAVAI